MAAALCCFGGDLVGGRENHSVRWVETVRQNGQATVCSAGWYGTEQNSGQVTDDIGAGRCRGCRECRESECLLVNGEEMCILVIHQPKRRALQLTGCRSDGIAGGL
jgi:hypothetical protein